MIDHGRGDLPWGTGSRWVLGQEPSLLLSCWMFQGAARPSKLQTAAFLRGIPGCWQGENGIAFKSRSCRLSALLGRLERPSGLLNPWFPFSRGLSFPRTWSSLEFSFPGAGTGPRRGRRFPSDPRSRPRMPVEHRLTLLDVRGAGVRVSKEREQWVGVRGQGCDLWPLTLGTSRPWSIPQ